MVLREEKKIQVKKIGMELDLKKNYVIEELNLPIQ